MNKDKLLKELFVMANRREWEVNREQFQGYLTRDHNLQGVLAMVLAQADQIAQQMISIDLQDPEALKRASKLQGMALGYRASVELILNVAFKPESDNARE